MRILSFSRTFLLALTACGLLSSLGCGGKFKLYPVAGKVTLDGKPLSQCAISFNADVSKGNTATVSCVGRLDGEGNFNLRTIAVKDADSGPGAPLGWYKVTVLTGLPGDPDIKVKPVFLDPNKSPLSVEVVASAEPGRYEFKMTSR